MVMISIGAIVETYRTALSHKDWGYTDDIFLGIQRLCTLMAPSVGAIDSLFFGVQGTSCGAGNTMYRSSPIRIFICNSFHYIFATISIDLTRLDYMQCVQVYVR